MARYIRPTLQSARKYLIKTGPVRRFSHGKEIYDDNLSLVLYNGSELEMEVRPIQRPREDEALIKVNSNCISPPDFKTWNKISGFHLTNKPSYTIGMCASGIIEKLGGITDPSLKEGERVVLEPGVCCMKCEYCLEGKTNLCKSIAYIGSELREGSFATYITHPTLFCHKLDPNVSFEVATLIPRVACAIHSYDRAKINSNSKVLIIGSGLMGLLTLLVYKHLGVGTILMAETSNHRIDLSKKLGAANTIKLAPLNSPEYPEYLKEIVYAIQSEEPNVTVDTLSTKYTIELAIEMTKKGGKVILMSFMSVPTEIPIVRGSWKEINFIGSYSYTHSSFQRALKLVAEKYSSLEVIVPFKIPFRRAIDAFSYARAMTREIVFILVKNEAENNQSNFGFEEIKKAFKSDETEKAVGNNSLPEKNRGIKNEVNKKHTSSSEKSNRQEISNFTGNTDTTSFEKSSSSKDSKINQIGDTEERLKEQFKKVTIDKTKERTDKNTAGHLQVLKDNKLSNAEESFTSPRTTNENNNHKNNGTEKK